MPADLSRPVPQGRAGTGVTPDRCDHSLRTLGCGTANKISWPVSYKARTRTPAAGRQVPRAAKSTFDSLKLQPLSRLPEAASQGTDRRAFRPCQGGCGFAALRTAQAGGRPLHGRAASRDGPAHWRPTSFRCSNRPEHEWVAATGLSPRVKCQSDGCIHLSRKDSVMGGAAFNRDCSLGPASLRRTRMLTAAMGAVGISKTAATGRLVGDSVGGSAERGTTDAKTLTLNF